LTEFLVVGCSRCQTRRVVARGPKTASCPRCGARIDLERARVLFAADAIEKAQAYLGEAAAREAGDLRGYKADVAAAPAPAAGRRKELRAIATSVGAATGRANQLKVILRRGFEAFGELAVEDLERIAKQAGMDASGAQLADDAVDLGLAGRTKTGALVPLREGR
jgi:hypothetical protein